MIFNDNYILKNIFVKLLKLQEFFKFYMEEMEVKIYFCCNWCNELKTVGGNFKMGRKC